MSKRKTAPGILPAACYVLRCKAKYAPVRDAKVQVTSPRTATTGAVQWSQTKDKTAEGHQCIRMWALSKRNCM